MSGKPIKVRLGDIHWTQAKVSGHFTNPNHLFETREAAEVDTAVTRLLNLPEDQRVEWINAKFPALRVVSAEYAAKTKGGGATTGWFSLDNRRLYVLKKVMPESAKVDVIDCTELDVGKEFNRKYSTTDLGESVLNMETQWTSKGTGSAQEFLNQGFDPEAIPPGRLSGQS